MNKAKSDKRFYIAIMLTLIISVSLTLGFTMAFFGDKKDGDTDVTLGASIYFDGERGVALTTSKTSAVVPGETVEVEATFVVKSGEGTPTPAVLKVIPTVDAGLTNATLQMSVGDTFEVKIDGETSASAVMLVKYDNLYLVKSSNISYLYDFTPTTDGTTISFKVPIKFPLNTPNTSSGKSCKVTMKGIVLQRDVYTDEDVKVETTVTDFEPYWGEVGEYIWEWSDDGQYIYMGEYPQSVKKASVTVSSEVDDDGYYLGSDGARYAKVTASVYGTGSEYKANDGTVLQSKITYYFKVERLKWRIIYNAGDNDYFLACDSIITAMAYQPNYKSSNGYYYATDNSGNILTDNGSNVYANNYKWSKLRSFLTDDFYNTAFTDAQKALIKTTTVDNSAYSTGQSSNSYACANTKDKIFALSYKDVTTALYGFSTGTSSSTTRTWKPTDYAKAHYAYVDSSSKNGYVWLRSPDSSYSSDAWNVDNDGSLDDYSVNCTYGGVVPALQLSL